MTTITDNDRMNPHRYHYQFIHGVMGNFVRNTLDYFVDYLYPRFSDVSSIVGSYDKAILYLRQQEKKNRELDKPLLPALIINPSGEFNISDSNTGAKQPWRFPNMAPGLVSRLFDPIYQDRNIKVTPGFSRVKGDLELIALVNSFYEMFDLKMLLLQIFCGGGDRVIHPVVFDSFIILPDEVYNYQYENDVEGISYTLDWDNNGATDKLVKTTNRNEHIISCKIKPLLKMTAIGDGSERYGGTDKLAEWRLTATIEYEMEIPSFLLMQTDYLAERIELNVRYGSTYSNYDDYNLEDVPVNIEKTKYEWVTGLVDGTSNVDFTLPEQSEIIDDKSLIFKTRYYHVVTEDQADSTSNIDITLPEVINDTDLLIVHSKNGPMKYDDHYVVLNGVTLRIFVEYVVLNENDVIEIFVYGEH